MRIITVIQDGVNINIHWFYKILDVLDKIIESNDVLKDNYTLERMDFYNHVSFDIMVNDDDEIVTWGGMYHRPCWDDGVYRVSNRVWVNPKYRSGFYAFLNPLHIQKKQLEKHKYNFAFISRENLKGKYYLKRAKKTVPHLQHWQLSEGLAHLVKGVNNKAVYQYILYDGTPFPFDTIGEEEWKLLT